MLALRSRSTQFVAVAVASAALSAQSWTQLSPAPYPTALARRSGGIAYDVLNNRLLMYGGLQSGPTVNLADMWAFDGVNWTAVTPATTPPARWGHRLVFDSQRFRLVTFGGRSPGVTTTASDTWEWDLLTGDWVQRFPTTSPNARAFYSMVYDERRGRTVLFGDMSGGLPGVGNQTWEWDGTNWAQIVTATTPPGLETPAMVYDKGRGVTVMFGGWNGLSPGTLYNTTWEYDGVDWTLRTTANAPAARYRAGCCYDEARARVLLYGGFGSGALQDTWEYDGIDWTQVATGGASRSTEGYMAWLPTTNQAVYFAGSGPGGTANETWVYSGPPGVTARYDFMGPGCAGPLGVPTNRSLELPRIGGNLRVEIGNVPAPEVALMFLGWSNTSSIYGPLPLDLNLALGSPPGCFGRVSTDMELLGFGGGGKVTLTQAVPAFVLGWAFYTQAFMLTPSGVIVGSDAVAGVVGN